MTDVDTSFYPKPTPLNPLDVYTQMQQTGGQILHNQNSQLELQYKNALNQATQAATDPQSGQLDTNKLQVLLSQLPGGGLHAQENKLAGLPLNAQTSFIGKDPQTGKQVLRTTAAQSVAATLNPQQQQAVDEAHDKIDALGSAATDLADNPNPTRGDAINSIIDLVNDGHISKIDAINTMADPNNPLPTGDNPQDLRKYGAIAAAKLHQHKQNLPPRSANKSGQNTAQPNSQTGDQLPPGQPNFQQSMLAGSQDNPTATIPTTPQGGGPASTTPAAPAGGNAAIPVTTDANGIKSLPGALPLGTERDTAANVDRSQALENSAQNYPQRKALLGHLEAANDQFTSGPLSHEISRAGKIVNEITGRPLIGADRRAAQEEFGKNAFQLAQQQFQALGGTGTDAKLGSAMSTSPSELLSQQGNKGIIHLLKGNEDALNAMNQEWQQYKAQNGPGSYDRFVTQFNQMYDPRVFQAKYMSKDERTKMLKGMSEQERQDFSEKYDLAHMQGWVK